MSWTHWGIVGYGVDLDDIEKYINKEKVNLLVREINPLENFDEDVFEDDTFCGNPYQNFGEFLSELDETKTIIWDDGGDSGKHFFLYEPKYPWMIKNNDPASYEDIENRIINVLIKVSDIDKETLRSKIDFISDYGSG